MKQFIKFSFLLVVAGLIIQVGPVIAKSIEDAENTENGTENFSEIEADLEKPVYNHYGPDFEARTRFANQGVCLNVDGVAMPVDGAWSGTHDHTDYQLYGADRSAFRPGGIHGGLDFGIGIGSPIRSVLPGTVASIGSDYGGGEFVIVDHGNGLQTGYYHLKANANKVVVGDTVTAGQQIAESGNTGAFTTGPHLHFTAAKNGKAFDPAALLYGDNGHSCATELACGPDLQGNSRAEEIYKFLIDSQAVVPGMTPELAAAFLGNFIAESGETLSPTAVNPESGAYGIAQWLGSRKTDLQNYAAQNGTSPGSLQLQLNFVIHEILGKETGSMSRIYAAGEGLSGSAQVTAYAIAIGNHYERYFLEEDRNADWRIESEQKRISGSQSAYRDFSDIEADPSAYNECGGGDDPVPDLPEDVFSYRWKDLA